MRHRHRGLGVPDGRRGLLAPRRTDGSLLPRRPLVDQPRRKSTPLRIVGRQAFKADPPGQNVTLDQPMIGPDDPRWVLAVRTSQRLQGDVLTPERRQQLQQFGRLLGLTPFSVSLIIAIVQDQARRGYAPQDCPTVGERELRMVQLSGPHNRNRKVWSAAAAIAMVLAVEVIVMKWWLFG